MDLSAALKKLLGVIDVEGLRKADSIAWNQYYGGIGGSRWFRWLDKRKVAYVRQVIDRLPAGGRVLDIGCGNGAIAAGLLRSDNRVTIVGIEGNAELAREGKKRGLRIVRADFDGSLPFAASSIDVVLMIDTLEHVRSRHRVMKEIRRVLKRDGVTMLFTPPYDSLSWLLGEHFVYALTGRVAVGHISPFTAESLVRILDEYFQDIAVHRFNFGLSMLGIGRAPRAGHD